jgi:hypothetical protein
MLHAASVNEGLSSWYCQQTYRRARCCLKPVQRRCCPKTLLVALRYRNAGLAGQVIVNYGGLGKIVRELLVAGRGWCVRLAGNRTRDYWRVGDLIPKLLIARRLGSLCCTAHRASKGQTSIDWQTATAMPLSQGMAPLWPRCESAPPDIWNSARWRACCYICRRL